MNYGAPGVYVEEVDSGSRTIQGRSTSIAAFVGLTPDADAAVNEAVAVNSLREFSKHFAPQGAAATHLAHAVHGFFLNGGSRCYVINTGSAGPIEQATIRRLEELDDVAMVAAPGATAIEDYDALITHCKGRSDRLAILDPPERVENIMDLTKVATATPSKSGAPERPSLRPPECDKAALYFPWLVIKNAFGPGTVYAPPSGFVAGIWARAAPHQPPANAGVAGALGVTYPIIDAEQAVLNPLGVNCIRHFSDSGPTVWGARTLAAQSSPFRYVNVRRLFCYIQTAIALDTRGYVFRPNDHNLWMTVRRNVSDFLRGQWRIGALHGRTPDEAFFVKCDEDTNPPESIREGKLVVEVGIAPVRPAEFVIFRVAHIESGTSNEEVARG
jgi:hypothetical protein